MSKPNPDSTPNTDNIDAPYASSLLRYDMQLKDTAALLTTMRVMLEYVPTTERVSLQALIDSAKTLHDDARSQLETICKYAEAIICAEYLRPNRVFERNTLRDSVEEELVGLGRGMASLTFKADELEETRRRFCES